MVVGAGEVELLDKLARADVVVFFLLLAYAFHKKWIVIGWVYRDLQERHQKLHERYDKAIENSDAWKEQAWTAGRITEAAVDTNKTIAEEALARGRQARRERG